MKETVQMKEEKTAVLPDAKDKEYKYKHAAAVCLVITAVSLGGFCLENIFVALTDGYMDNRNMMLPFLFGYGLAMAAVYGMFGTPTSPRFFGLRLPQNKIWLNLLYYFAVVFLCVSVGECALGLFVERAFDITWWDYTRIPLHITKYTSVPTSTCFTVLIMIFMHLVFLPLKRLFLKMNPKVLYILAVVFMVLLSLDFVSSGIRMYLTGDLVRIWKIKLR